MAELSGEGVLVGTIVPLFLLQCSPPTWLTWSSQVPNLSLPINLASTCSPCPRIPETLPHPTCWPQLEPPRLCSRLSTQQCWPQVESQQRFGRHKSKTGRGQPRPAPEPHPHGFATSTGSWGHHWSPSTATPTAWAQPSHTRSPAVVLASLTAGHLRVKPTHQHTCDN